jgi:hypothetical protein
MTNKAALRNDNQKETAEPKLCRWLICIKVRIPAQLKLCPSGY